MKNETTTRADGRSGGRIGSAFGNSVIISALDRFCLYIYDLLGRGLFAKLFSTHGKNEAVRQSSVDRKESLFTRIRHRISEGIENSSVLGAINRFASGILSCRMRVIGTFLMAFAAYTGLFALITVFISDSVISRYDALVRIVEAVTIGIASIFFLVSKSTVSKTIRSSGLLCSILSTCGFLPSKLKTDKESGKYVYAFIFGIICGVISPVVAPLYVFIGILALIAIYTILSVPEFGVVCMFLAMPFAPTIALAGLTIFVTFAFLVKLIRGKRVLRIEKIDVIVAIFAVLLFCGGFVSMSTGSIAPALMFVCFIVGFFLVSCCLRSGEWVTRCIGAFIISALAVSVYGIFQYFFDATLKSAWIDHDMFGNIAGRAISTLENPNMLGEYLILVMPIAIAMWLSSKGQKKKAIFCTLFFMAACLILTWSRGAWIGFLLAFIILLLMWNRRAVWIIVGGVIAVPFATLVLPAEIVNRITSIGNMADSSTSYRVGIWRGAMHMIKDHLLTGIGIGEKAWGKVYPDYTLPGIEKAPHSHNLFMQITLETGIFGIIVFLLVLILLVKITFTLVSDVSASEKDFGKDKSKSALRLAVAGPFCGLFAVLIQGLTDYSWYNYRVFLMFWLTAGLIPAIAKHSKQSLSAPETCSSDGDGSSASVDISLAKTIKHSDIRKESAND